MSHWLEFEHFSLMQKNLDKIKMLFYTASKEWWIEGSPDELRNKCS